MIHIDSLRLIKFCLLIIISFAHVTTTSATWYSLPGDSLVSENIFRGILKFEFENAEIRIHCFLSLNLSFIIFFQLSVSDKAADQSITSSGARLCV